MSKGRSLVGVFISFIFIVCFNSVAAAQTTKAKNTVFGYLGIKAGYSNLFSKKAHFSAENQRVFSFPAQSRGTFVVGAAGGVGYTLLPFLGIRTELEYLYRAPTDNWKAYEKRSGGDVEYLRPEQQIHTLLVNAYLDWHVLPKLILYAGFGLGVSITDITMKYKAGDPNGYAYSESYINAPTVASFAWQAGLGIGYNFNDHWGIDFNARYSDFGKTTWKRPALENAKSTFHLTAVEALLTVSYRF